MATGHYRERKTKSGVSYQLTVETDRDPITGKRERHYETFKGTKKQMEARLRKFIEEVENGGVVTTSSMKLCDWLNQWTTQFLPNVQQSTKDSYIECINNRINPYLGSFPLKVLNASTIQSWINTLNTTLSVKTIHNVYNILNPALKKAVKLRMIPYNPCEAVELPKREKYQAEVYDDEDIGKVLELAKGTDMYLIILLELTVGLRRGELGALTWDDVDFKNKVITINKSTYEKYGKKITKKPKTYAGNREISIGDQVVEELKHYRKEYLLNKMKYGAGFKDENKVICKEDGSSYHLDTLSQKWKKFIAKNNLKSIRFHDLRHSNATTLIANGVDIKTVQARLGHASIGITMDTYAHCTKKMNENAANKIDEIITKNKIS